MSKNVPEVSNEEVNLPEEYKGSLNEYTKELPPSIIKINQSGGFSFGDDVTKTIKTVIMDYGVLKVFYDTAWDSKNKVPPKCCAIDRSLRQISPHENVKPEDRQSDFCSTCKQNQWGSGVDLATGAKQKGKACREYRPLILIPFDDPDGHMFIFKVPPTSIRSFDSYSKRLSLAGYNHPIMVTTTISTVRKDEDSFPTLKFECEENSRLSEFSKQIPRAKSVFDLIIYNTDA